MKAKRQSPPVPPEPDLRPKATYLYRKPLMEGEQELEDAHSVLVQLPGGMRIELHYRRGDGELSLSSDNGRLSIEPVAANVVRIGVRNL